MNLRVDTDHLRRILAASLPTGARGAELFIESRITVSMSIARGDDGADPAPRIERRWETGAHLRRFFEGRHESFVLDAPTAESLEALALHPEAVAVDWLSGRAPLGLPPSAALASRTAGLTGDGARDTVGPVAIEASLSDASPSTAAGPWSEQYLTCAIGLLQGWLKALDVGTAGGDGARIVRSGACLDAGVQEILVLATDRNPARDTRQFVDATLDVVLARADLRGRCFATEERRSAVSLEDVARAPATGDGPPATLLARAARGFEAVASPHGEMPVIFASPSGGFLLHEICGHLLEADHVLRGASPFAGARGRAIASPLLSMADDGSIPGMRGSTLFDDEGVAARRTPLIMEGTLVGYLSDRLTALATNGISTGNGRRQSYRDSPMPRMTNLVIDPGCETLEEILSSTPSGLLVTRLGRGRVDPATGRFALAVEEGSLIQAGRPGAPVSGAVLRGSATDLLPAIDAVGADSAADRGSPLCVKEEQALPFGILQPTLRVRSMAVTGAER